MMGESQYNKHSIPVDILDEVSARFIVNLNQEERNDFVRICFQIEEAHWFFIDFYVNKQPERKLQSGTIRTFAEHLFRHVPFLQDHVGNLDEILEEWRYYKLSVPTYGAIILNSYMDKVLLVQGFWAKTSWGFPKGKINQDEDPHICAAREVYEETGYDISDKVDPDVYLEHQMNGQLIRLYIVQGVQEDTRFLPMSRCEIRDIRWFDLNTLPLNKSDLNCKIKNGYNPNSFYMAIPFVRELKQYVQGKLWERLQFQDENADKKNRSVRKVSKGELRKTPVSVGKVKTTIATVTSEERAGQNRDIYYSRRISEERILIVPGSGDGPAGELKSKEKKSRRQLFEENASLNALGPRQGSTVQTPAGKQDTVSTTGQPTAVRTSKPSAVNSSHPTAVSTGRPSAVSTSKPSAVNSSHPTAVSTGHPTAVSPGRPSAVSTVQRQYTRVETRIVTEAGGPNIKPDNEHRRQPGLDSSHPVLLPVKYCPKSWSNFRLDEESLMMAFLSLPVAFSTTSPAVSGSKTDNRRTQRIRT